MKYIICFSFIFFSSLVAAQNPKLDLRFTNIQPAQGLLHIGIYNQAKGFPEIEGTFWNKIVSVGSEKYELIVQDLPAGKYCVSVFHDKNANHIFDFNFFGWPLETYGFSKNIFHRFRAPYFEECAFELVKDESLEIKLVK